MLSDMKKVEIIIEAVDKATDTIQKLERKMKKLEATQPKIATRLSADLAKAYDELSKFQTQLIKLGSAEVAATRITTNALARAEAASARIKAERAKSLAIANEVRKRELDLGIVEKRAELLDLRLAAARQRSLERAKESDDTFWSKTIGRMSRSAVSIAGVMTGMAVTGGLFGMIKTGIDINRQFEDLSHTMAAVLLTYNKFVDSQGRSLSTARAFGAAMEEAKDTIAKLVEVDKETPATLDQLLKIATLIQASGGAAKQLTSSQVAELSKLVSIAMQMLRIPEQGYPEEVRSILGGRIGPTSWIARAFGITSEEVSKLRGEAYMEYMRQRLSGIVAIADYLRNTLTYKFQEATNTLRENLRDSFADFFEQLKKDLDSMTKWMKSSEGREAISTFARGVYSIYEAIKNSARGFASLSMPIVKSAIDVLGLAGGQGQAFEFAGATLGAYIHKFLLQRILTVIGAGPLAPAVGTALFLAEVTSYALGIHPTQLSRTKESLWTTIKKNVKSALNNLPNVHMVEDFMGWGDEEAHIVRVPLTQGQKEIAQRISLPWTPPPEYDTFFKELRLKSMKPGIERIELEYDLMLQQYLRNLEDLFAKGMGEIKPEERESEIDKVKRFINQAKNNAIDEYLRSIQQTIGNIEIDFLEALGERPSEVRTARSMLWFEDIKRTIPPQYHEDLWLKRRFMDIKETADLKEAVQNRIKLLEAEALEAQELWSKSADIRLSIELNSLRKTREYLEASVEDRAKLEELFTEKFKREVEERNQAALKSMLSFRQQTATLQGKHAEAFRLEREQALLGVKSPLGRAAVEEYYEEMWKRSLAFIDEEPSFLGRLRKALIQSTTDMSDWARNMQSLGQSVIDSLENSFVAFFDMTSRRFLDFRQLALSVLGDIARESWRLLVMRPLLGKLGSLFAGVALPANTPAELDYTALVTKHSGGYVVAHGGYFAYNEVPAILQKGEYVVSRKGVEFLDRINEGKLSGSVPNVQVIVNNNAPSAKVEPAQPIEVTPDKVVLGIVINELRTNPSFRTSLREAIR